MSTKVNELKRGQTFRFGGSLAKYEVLTDPEDYNEMNDSFAARFRTKFSVIYLPTGRIEKVDVPRHITVYTS